MIQPPDIKEEMILSAVREAYGLDFQSASFLPVGADAHSAAYRLADADGGLRFLKLRKGPFEEASVRVPLFLFKQGIQQVIAPFETRSGAAWVHLGGYVFLLYPFLDARNGYERSLTDQHRIELGAALKKIHSVRLPEGISRSMTVETFGPRWRDLLVKFQQLIEQGSFSEPIAQRLAALMKRKRAEIDQVRERASQLARVLQARPHERVLCHSDLHAGNLLIDQQEKLYIVDWDNPILARRERDLMFVGAGIDRLWMEPRHQELFYRGYGAERPDPACLAYYRYERIVEDLVAYCEQLLLSEAGGQDREDSFGYFASNFLPAGTIEMARRVDTSLK